MTEQLLLALWLFFAITSIITAFTLGYSAWREAQALATKRSLWLYDKRDSRWDDVRRKK